MKVVKMFKRIYQVILGINAGALIGLLFAIIIIVIIPQAHATGQPEALKGIGITEHLGRQLPLQNLTFRNEEGTPVALSQLIQGQKPVILTLVYYSCPMLCNLMLNGLLDSMKKLDWDLGKQYEIVSVSINPQETSELAVKKKQTYLKNYNRPGAASGSGWHFLTGAEPEIQTLASEVGFQYRYDAAEKQYIHAAAIYILTPGGKISRYLYGTTFAPQNLKLALLEASNGRVASSTLDRVLLFCFHFDPTKNSYTLKVWRVVQGVLTIQVILLAGLLTYLWRRNRAEG